MNHLCKQLDKKFSTAQQHRLKRIWQCVDKWLPLHSSWIKILDYDQRSSKAKKYGLPLTATWKQINEARVIVKGAETERKTRQRLHLIDMLGLSLDASDLEIETAQRDLIRKIRAKKVGLSETASLKDVLKLEDINEIKAIRRKKRKNLPHFLKSQL